LQLTGSTGAPADSRATGPVVHVIAPSHAGGAESVVIALAAAAKDRTRVVILNQVATPGAPPFPLAEHIRRRGVAVEEIRCGRRRYGAEARALERHLREIGACLVHTHGYHATWVGYRAAKRARLPVVATVHGYLKRSLKERLYNALDRRLLRRFDGIIAVSQGIRDQLVESGVDGDRVRVVQNGLPAPIQTGGRAAAREQLGLGADERVAGWIGRLSHEKGPDIFLRALALSNASGRAIIVGEGPELNSLQELARTLGLEDERVRFVGYRPDAAELLPAFDVMALTSRMEGTPMVILEAVAAGVPIVAFEVGGVPQLLNNDTAWLVPAENIAALAVALRAALSSPEDGARRAASARARLADRLSLDRWLENVWSVYVWALNKS